ncbi:MAG: DUF423 domain-containing protein [Acidobacteriota bacterium]|nr:DUF423 domain-containing protein [Acidobacteriota bacterium]
MRFLGSLGALYGLCGVAIGAFAAHVLAERLSVRSQELIETGVRYQLVHALALLVAVWMAGTSEGSAGPFRWAAALFAAGVPLFAGSLYLLALGAPSALGGITPIGGLLFLAGWLALAVGAWRAGG